MNVNLFLTIHGMGKPVPNDTMKWIQKIYPETNWIENNRVVNGRSIDYLEGDVDGDKAYVFEFYYDDINMGHQDKRPFIDEQINKIENEALKSFLSTHVQDVATAVLVPDAREEIVTAFVQRYLDMVRFMEELHPADTAVLSILCHSLGTYIAYEGIHQLATIDDLFTYFDLRCALCAPMLDPIGRIQRLLGIKSHIASKKNVNPVREHLGGSKLILDTLLTYNNFDPFYLIQRIDEYKKHSADTFYKDYFEFSQAEINNINTHDMDTYYMPNAKTKIKELFS